MTSSTLLDVMNKHVHHDSSSDVSLDDTTTALHCWNGAQKTYYPVSYSSLSKRAFAFGATLIAHRESSKSKVDSGASIAGSIVMIACHSPYATLVAFYGAISVGAIPMIFPMPLSLKLFQEIRLFFLSKSRLPHLHLAIIRSQKHKCTMGGTLRALQMGEPLGGPSPMVH